MLPTTGRGKSARFIINVHVSPLTPPQKKWCFQALLEKEKQFLTSYFYYFMLETKSSLGFSVLESLLPIKSNKIHLKAFPPSHQAAQCTLHSQTRQTLYQVTLR